MTSTELRDIDVAVHTKVMGLECRPDRGRWVWDTSHDYPEPVPEYTSDWEYVGAVLDRLKGLHWNVTIYGFVEWEAKVEFSCGCGPCPYHHNPHENYHSVDAWGATIPVAVCLAALKAIVDTKTE